jgi:hypothetical protein
MLFFYYSSNRFLMKNKKDDQVMSADLFIKSTSSVNAIRLFSIVISGG